VTPDDLGVEVLQQPDAGMSACVCARRVARELEEVELVWDADRARKVGDEDDTRLQRRDEHRLQAVVVALDLPAQLADACPQFLV
jgi:hypothetical protein